MGTENRNWKRGAVGAFFTVVAGWVFGLLPIVRGLPDWSYDLPQLFRPSTVLSNVVIVYMDEQANRDYGQQHGQPWARTIHTTLLKKLAADRPRTVVFDVAFTESTEEDPELAQAIRENGGVVLAGGLQKVPNFKGVTELPPPPILTNAAAAWGIAKVQKDPDLVVRRLYPGTEQTPSLAWAAAEIAEAPITQNSQNRWSEERWLNYYPDSALPSMSYTNAESQAGRGFFHDKSVFIGGKAEPLNNGEIADVFGTPLTRFDNAFVPGVDIIATAFANLMYDDWLRRLPPFLELTLLLVTGLSLACIWAYQRPWTATILSLIGGLLVPVASILLVLHLRVWFCWTAVLAVQIPCALLVRMIFDLSARSTAEEVLAPTELAPRDWPPSSAPRPTEPVVADHELLNAIGLGAYGQVWLARNAVGIYHAVKIIYRNRFSSEDPYERAFRGIKKFMPISRSHDGFVHILHVGRNDQADYFYYVMEAGDDQRTEQRIDPENYAPKNLATELQEKEQIPPRQCLLLMLKLTETVEELHQNKLIHRDIKPSNIIYVRSRPKLADIDLVTDLSVSGEVSQLGTEGYLAPEGPGTAAADVFSLGRVLYVASTGKPPHLCPDLPTRITSQPDWALTMELNQICCKACEIDLNRRYASAAQMREALLELSNRWASAE